MTDPITASYLTLAWVGLCLMTGARCYQTGAVDERDEGLWETLDGRLHDARDQARCAAQDVGLVPHDVPSPEIARAVLEMLAKGE